MRLIDADKLLNKIEAYMCGSQDVMFVKELIKQQATAFDVDKIEKELRSLKQYDNEYCSYYNHSIYMMTDFQNEIVNRTIDKVLEIVRRGRIDD